MVPRHKLKSFTFRDEEKARNKRFLFKKKNKDIFWPIKRGDSVYSAIVAVVAVVLAVAHVLRFCPIV